MDPFDLIEILQLLKPETNAGHRELYDEMLQISKEQITKQILTHEELENT